MSAVLGVDPGVNGGMALVQGDGRRALAWPLDVTQSRATAVETVRAAVGEMISVQTQVCFFEKVQHMTGDGGQGSHTFGRIAGLLEGALRMARIDLYFVTPQMWQTSMGCLSGGNKNVTKRKAQELFPELKITHAIADALLIAEYGRRIIARRGVETS